VKTLPVHQRSLRACCWLGSALLACLGEGAAGQSIPQAAPAQRQPTFLFKRLDYSTEQQLRDQLLKVRELDLQADAPEQYANLQGEIRAMQAFRNAGAGPAPQGPAGPDETLTKLHREACAALGLGEPAAGEPLAREEAKHLATWSAELRRQGLVSLPDRNGAMTAPRWKGVSLGSMQGRNMPAGVTGIPALVQMLQAEDAGSRQLLIALLREMDTAPATVGLARQAIFDPAAENRGLALAALRTRSAAQYRAVFLEALRHPWLPAAQHAAEGLAALQDDGAVPELKAMLAEVDPAMPHAAPGGTAPQVRELVRINHLRNCLLCHAAAMDRTVLLRAPMPIPGRPLAPEYYGSRSAAGLVVRADITYVRQEFSVLLPVANAKPWPEQQRYDFVVRRRKATPEELTAREKAATRPTWPQREAVQFALQELNP